MDVMTIVRDSLIQGLGLFSAQYIPAGCRICRIEGQPTRRNGPHVLWLDGRRGIVVANDARYINHSDQPNACYYDDLTLHALRDIHPGEEITHDYRGDLTDADDDLDFAA
ncbi:MAG: SET domain-containing protein [Phycisphaeraceae bacterium]|nr:SET domain-containing protein [Phycisphaeraceae bacterium]